MAKSHKAGEFEVAQKEFAALPKRVRLRNCQVFCRSALGLFVLMGQATLSVAGQNDTFSPYLASSLKFDSNLLRLSDTVSVQERTGKNAKSDFIKEIRGGIDIDWQLSRQQLLLKAELNQTWFDTYDELDYLGHNLLGQWNWELGQNLKGDVGYGNKKSLGSFNQINRLIKNLQTEEKYFADGAYQISSDWFLLGGLSRNDLLFSGGARQVGNLREDSLETGIQYLNPAKNMLGIKVRQTDGLYPNRSFMPDSPVDNAYFRSDYHLEGAWNYSIKTRLDGRIGYTQQDYDHLNVRNFSAITSRANVYWAFSTKTDVLLSGWREIAQANNLISSFVLSQGVRLIPSWSVTPKVKLGMMLSYENQDFLGETGIEDAETFTQKDRIALIGLNLHYNPFINTEMSAVIKHEERDSNNPLRTYQSQFGGINIKLAF